MATDALEYVQIGRIIYIEDAIAKSWPFVVARVSSDGVVVLKAVGRKSTGMQISSSNSVIIVIPNETSGAYSCEATVIDRDNLFSYLKLQLRGITEHIQRREYFRMLKPPASVIYQFIERGQAEQDVPQTNGRILDLSGKGIGIIACLATPPNIGCKALLNLTIDGHNNIEIIGEVVRVIVRSAIKQEYLIGTYFRRINESDRRRIIHFVTQTQLDILHTREESK